MQAGDNVRAAEEKNHLWIIVFFKRIPTLEHKVFPWSLFRGTVFIHAVNMIIALFNTFHIADVKKLDAERRLLINMNMVRDKKLAKYDLAMNAWAKVDPLVHEVVKKVIKMRLDFNRAIFAELGFDGDELEMRTRLFVCYHSWEEIMFTDDSDDKNLRPQKLRYKMFIK